MKPIHERSIANIKDQIDQLKKVYQECSEIFQGIESNNTIKALENIYKSIGYLDKELMDRNKKL